MSTSTNWTCTTRASYQCSCMLRIAVRYQRWTHVGSVMSAYAAWDHMVPVCSERWCTEANEATQTHCYNPVVPAYHVWAYYAHGRQCRCQEDLVSLPFGRLKRQSGRPRITWLSIVQQDLKQHHLTLLEAADLAQNRRLWRMMSMYGAAQS